jgi:hypothetical protein
MLELVSPECRGLVSRKAETVQKSVQDVVNRMLDTLNKYDLIQYSARN